METATISAIKKELEFYSQNKILAITLRLAKFKKENKELLSYLLFEADNEEAFMDKMKAEMTEEFANINTSSYFFIKKSVRRILKNVKKIIRFSSHKETEIALLIHFCAELKALNPTYLKNVVLTNMYNNQLRLVKNKISTLHEDLQYDYSLELNTLNDEG